MKKKIIVAVVLIILIAVFLIVRQPINFNAGNNNQNPSNRSDFDKNRYSLSMPSSPWVIVNKKRPLPRAYSPNGLVYPDVPLRSPGSSEMLLKKIAASQLETLVASAKKKGLNLRLDSGYRSYGLQANVFAGNVSREGRVNAEKTSARPGHSEHQTGLAADVGRTDSFCMLKACFGSTPEGKWLASNAYKYGYIIRYQKNKQNIVGFTYEPWHLRYVGKSLATEINKSGQSLEEFFGLPAAPSY